MSNSEFQDTNINQPTFSINYATIVLFLVILIPAVYIVYTNLEKPTLPTATENTNTTTPNPQSIIEEHLKAVEANPNYQTYLNLGLAYYNAARYEEGIEAWGKALEFDPQSATIYNNIGAAYGALNQWDNEIAACEKALAIDPNFDLAKRNIEWAKSMKSQNQ